MLRTIVAAGLATLGLSLGLSGCSGGGGSGGPPGGSLTIQGLVLSAIGEPIPNVAVWISGNGPFLTDGIGQFTAQGMPSPYDAVVVYGAGGVADVWPGLTRPDPVFQFPDVALSANGNASISGTVMGGVGYPLPAGHDSEVFVTFHDAFGVASDTPNSTTGAYDFMNLQWVGVPTTGASLVGLQYTTDSNGDPVTFTGAGMLQIGTLTPNDVLTMQDIPLAPVPTGLVDGTISVAPGHSPFLTALLLRPVTGGFFALSSSGFFSNAFALPAPITAFLERDLLVYAYDASTLNLVISYRKNLPDPAMNLAVTVPPATGLVLPISGAVGVTHDTLFQVTPNPGDRVFTVTFEPDSGPGPTIHLRTTASTFTIPDLSAYGVTLPAGGSYTWDLDAHGPLTSLDERATPADNLVFFNLVSDGTGDAFLASAANGSFTFGP